MSGWEHFASLAPLYAAGDYEAYIEHAKPLIGAHPEYGMAPYNLACVESLTGRTDDAIEHLRAAVELWPRSRQLARSDPDFDSIRDEPRFKEVIG